MLCMLIQRLVYFIVVLVQCEVRGNITFFIYGVVNIKRVNND